MKKCLSLLAALPLLAVNSPALPITVDEIIFQNGAGLNSALLAPQITMTLSGSVLTMSLRNLSPDSAGDGALVAFTGLAFALPAGVSVAGGSNPGSVTETGTQSPDWVNGDSGDEAGWGYDYNSGGLSVGALAFATRTGYNVTASTIASNGKNNFAGGGNAGGMDYIIYSLTETSLSPSPWVKDSLNLTLNLNLGTYNPANLLTAINNGNVAAIFGSPAGTPSVPDGGATLALLGAALVLLGSARKLTS